MKTKPYGLPLMLEAWQGCVAFAAKETKAIAAFLEQCSEETKKEVLRSMRGRSPIERMVDVACGRDEPNPAVWAEFCDWVTISLWGVEE